ncbi:hypothetical protein ACQ4LE_009936 [Meloidogyne hapla]
MPKSRNSLLLNLFIDDQPKVLFYAVTGTVILIVLVLIAIRFASKLRINRLNWYEQNLNEIASTSSTNYVRCKALPRLDTDDLPDEDWKSRPPIRKQSRIHEVNQHSLDIIPSSSSRDPTDVFIVPKLQRQSNASLISMFSSLDQSQLNRGLYTSQLDQVPESEYDKNGSCGNCGSLKLALCMDNNLNLLTVSLRQAIDLIAKRQDGQPNPYFKVALDIPESPFPKIEHRSKICKATSSPIVAEDFFFQIPQCSISQCRLEILVLDYDQCSVDECIGYCSLTLGRLATISSNRQQATILWAEVLPVDDDGNGFGEALFSLSYLSRAQRLTVNFFKARNLRIPERNSIDLFSSVAVRVTLIVKRGDRKFRRKKTSSKRIDRNVQFNESITFHMPKCSLCDSILEFEVVHEYGTFGMASKVLGRLELPLHRCRELWRAIIREESAQASWHTLEAP